MATYTKLKSGEWGIRIDGTTTVGATVTVSKKDGGTKSETIKAILWSGRDNKTGRTVSLCAIAQREPAGASRHGSYATIGQRNQARMDRTGWTGCSCGSIEGHPRPSDCFSCRHDSE